MNDMCEQSACGRLQKLLDFSKVRLHLQSLSDLWKNLRKNPDLSGVYNVSIVDICAIGPKFF